jgi:eukaryotic-like serine/threonine-protein kinase
MAEVDEKPAGADPAARRQRASSSDGLAETAAVETGTAVTLPAAGADRPIPRGEAIGRYVVLEMIGSGAMGVVYAAYDRDLDRRIALKLVRDPDRSSARRRLLREAKALAQLSHPQVVAVFDVGTYRDQVFLAMELVSGQNLRSWLADRPRSEREIVDVYRRAGEGLAAAHAAGVVHRDFKPDNVLIDDRGRVRVADFGIALIEWDDADAGEDTVAEGDGDRPAGAEEPVRLTATGAVVGTPAYMAPEQRSGCLPVDARSDQFAFAVSLHEALCGERPFEIESSAGAGPLADISPLANELEARARLAVEPPAAEAARRLPARLRRVLRRALATDPDQRYPSMDALLADLGRDPTARRRVALAAGGAALLAAGALALASGLDPDEATPCRSAGDQLAGVWDGARRQKLQSAFRASRSPVAENSRARVEAAFDGFASGWVAMRREACEATHVRGDQPEDLLDKRIECLDQRRTEVRALVDLLSSAEADAAAVENSIQAVQSLPPLAGCADRAALSEDVPPPVDPARRTRLAGLRERLAQIQALVITGKYEKSLAPTRQLATDAAALGYRPFEAEVLGNLSDVQRYLGDVAGAEESLYRAVSAGQAGRAPRLTAERWIELAWLVGVQDQRRAEGHRLARLARGAVDRVGPDDDLESKLEGLIGTLYLDDHKFREARPHLERSLALSEKVNGADGFFVAEPIQTLAILAEQEQKYDESLRLHRRARALVEKALGPEHPTSIALLTGESSALSGAGRHDEALALNRRGVALAEKALGPFTEIAATFHNNSGYVLKDNGRDEEALVELERALVIYERLYGPDHAHQAGVHLNMGTALYNLKRHREAISRYEKAVAIFEKSGGPDHPDVALTLASMGEVFLADGKPARAVAPLERAVAIYERAEAPAGQIGGAHYFLGQALWKTRRDRAAARRHFAAALERFEEAGEEQGAAEVTEWLARTR